MQISLIEDLFQVQMNAFRFANHDLYIKTPILAAVAAFCWLVPIAAVYPPGALVVGLQASKFDTRFNVSVLHQKTLQETGRLNTIAMIWCDNETWTNASPMSTAPELQNMSTRQNCIWQPTLVSLPTPQN
jgi:hypothetical protein